MKKSPSNSADRLVKKIKGSYVVVSKRSIHPFYSWALLAAVVGFIFAVVYVSQDKDLTFSDSLAKQAKIISPETIAKTSANKITAPKVITEKPAGSANTLAMPWRCPAGNCTLPFLDKKTINIKTVAAVGDPLKWTTTISLPGKKEPIATLSARKAGEFVLGKGMPIELLSASRQNPLLNEDASWKMEKPTMLQYNGRIFGASEVSFLATIAATADFDFTTAQYDATVEEENLPVEDGPEWWKNVVDAFGLDRINTWCEEAGDSSVISKECYCSAFPWFLALRKACDEKINQCCYVHDKYYEYIRNNVPKGERAEPKKAADAYFFWCLKEHAGVTSPQVFLIEIGFDFYWMFKGADNL